MSAPLWEVRWKSEGWKRRGRGAADSHDRNSWQLSKRIVRGCRRRSKRETDIRVGYTQFVNSFRRDGVRPSACEALRWPSLLRVKWLQLAWKIEQIWSQRTIVAVITSHE